MEISRQGNWSGLPFYSPGDLPDPGIKPKSPALQADALSSEPLGRPRKIKSFIETFFFKIKNNQAKMKNTINAMKKYTKN